MKVAILCDSHFGARNDNSFFLEYMLQFYEGIFFPYLQQHDIKTVIHLGDLMDRRKYVSIKTAKEFRERFMLPINHLKLDFHCLVGNHDIFFKNTNDVNSLRELIDGRSNKIKIYEDPTEVNIGGLDILFLPWITPQNQIYTEGMIDSTDASIVMGHLEIKGFQMYKGIQSDHGIDKSLFSKFQSVFSGHYHHKSDDGQIYYLGTPYQMTWSDYNCPKGFHVFDTETRELHRIVNPNKIFEKIYYDDTQENYDNHDVSQYTNKYVKLVVVNKNDLYKFDKFTDRLFKADCHEVKIIEDFTDLDANTVSDDIVENSQDTMTLLGKYIDDLDINLDKTKLKTDISKLYHEAQDLEL